MSEDRKATEDRRRFLKIVGGSAVIVPMIGLTACSGGKDEAPAAAAPKAEPAPAMDKPKAMESAPTEAAAPESSSSMPKISEDNPQAKSLSYVHDATTIDASQQPRYKAGQECANCALFQAKADEEWAGCSIFPGKAVNARGWCSVYAPKPA